MPHGGLFFAPDLPTPECMLLIDCGYSYTHVTPIVNGQVIWSGIKRCVSTRFATIALSQL